jgi:hypothetical protein
MNTPPCISSVAMCAPCLTTLPMARCIYVLVTVTLPVADLAPSVTYLVHDLAQRETTHKICDKVCTVFMRGF